MLRKDELKLLKPGRTSDPAEIEKFDRLAEEWWRPDGAFKVVHKFNAARVAYLKDSLPRHFGRDPAFESSLAGLRVADIGCGAGLVSEALAKIGASVLGIDAAERNIEIARRHAELNALTVTYRHELPETLVAEGSTFDIVLSLEVVEHVADLPAFLASLAGLVAPGGILVIGTLNRTVKSFALAIIGAEYVLRWLPRGTHDWRRFVSPHELCSALARHGLAETWRTGIALEPLSGRWHATPDVSVNYLLALSRSPISDRQIHTVSS